MRLTLTGAIVLTLLASRPAAAQMGSEPVTRATSSPALLNSISGSTPSDAPPLSGPPEASGPPRIAQYPLEDDPYEAPPKTRGTNQYGATLSPSPQTTSPTWTPEVEDDPWILWDNTQITGTYIHGTNNSIGWGDVVAKGTLTFPDAPWIWLGPQLGAHFLESSRIGGVPSEVYDVSMEITTGLPLNDNWSLSAAISPGIFSDFSGAGGDEFRLPARLFAFYKWSETLTLGGGYLFLDRPDITGLPLIGLSYIPSDDFRAELWFPRPKVSKRYYQRGDVERWIYGVGEFGGGSWAIERNNGQSDSLAYRDYRLMIGVEQKCPTGLGWFVEGGFVFGRRLEFDRTNQEIEMDQTTAMQAGVRF
jgi:hypothetical protein